MAQERSPAPLLTARGIMDKNVSVATKEQYARYSGRIKDWMAVHHPEFIVDNDLQIDRIPLLVIEELFEHQQYKRDKGSDVSSSDRSFVSKSRMDFFRKVIVFDLKKKGVDPIPRELVNFFSQYFKGYSNVIANERHEGRMNEKEGKDPLSGKFIYTRL